MSKEFFGSSVKALEAILKDKKPGKIFLVADKDAYEKSGARALFSPLLKGFTVAEFSEFQENPKIEDVKNGVEAFRSFDPDLVLAVGGGSALDMAKSVNVLASQEGNSLDYVLKRKEIAKKGKPLVAIPTTAGTGAEATHFAVVYVEGVKHSLVHPYVEPTHNIVDPELTLSLPSRVTASTGMDALAQAIESFWSNKSTEESKEYAKEAISLILPNFVVAVNAPTLQARIAMSRGAHLAGKAINLSFTTACHAISYSLTEHYGIPHGHAVGFTLPALIMYNAPAIREDTLSELLSLFNAQSAFQAAERVTSLMKEIGLETKLNQLGIFDDEQIENFIMEEVNLERLENNPRIVAREALRDIVRSIL